MLKGIVASKQIYFRPICTNDIDNGWLEWVNDPIVNKYLVNTENRLGDVQRNFSDISKAKSVLGWSPVETLETGLQKTIQYFLQ